MSGRIQRERRSLRTSSIRARHSLVVTSDDAFTYALRTAYLHYLLQPRPRRQVPAPAPAPPVNKASTASFHELMRDFNVGHREGKGTRFPKDFLGILQKRLEAVWMGRDYHMEYKDANVKRTFGSFYAVFKEPRTYDGFAKSRRPEDLILIFYSSATKELQRVYQGDEDAWKPLVDRHVALFVRLMFSVIRDHGWSSNYPELASRLGNLEKKLLRHDENLTDESSRSPVSGTVLGPPEPLSYKTEDMPMVQIVSQVFDVPLRTCQQEIDKNRIIWTEKAALQDMKAYTNALSLNTKRTLRSDDFGSEEAYEAWRKAETQELSKVMLAIIQSNPQELAKTTSVPAPRRLGHTQTMPTQSLPGQVDRNSLYSPTGPSTLRLVEQSADVNATTMANESSVEEDDTPYVYVPPDPRLYYRHVIEACLTYDLNDPDLVPMDIPEADGPIRLFSKTSLSLLELCALRWRIPKYSRMVLFMDVVRGKYADQDIDLVTLDGAFMYFKSEVGSAWQIWTISDQNLFKQILMTAHDFVLRELYDILQHAYDTKAKPIGSALWVLDQHIYSEELFVPSGMDSYIEQLKEGLKGRAEQVLVELLQELPEGSEDLDPLHLVETTQKVVKLAQKISKRFKEPVLGAVDPVMIFIEVVFPQFAAEARALLGVLMKGLKHRGEEMDIEDGFELYRELSEIRRIYLEAFPRNRFPVEFEEFMAEFVWRWLQTVDSKVIGWVDAAIKEDDFVIRVREEEGREPEDNERHTSSAVDIFRSFNQPVDYIKKLEWGNDFQYAKFMTTLAKILGKGISRYCEVLEKLFTFEMDKPRAEQEAAAVQTRQQRWMAMAREAWNNKDKIEPFQFAPESCVKLNNIEFALQQFDKLEHSVDADRLAEVISRYTPQQTTRGKTSYVFTIKIIEAEDLKAMDINGSSDPYVVLGDEYQKRLAKTRIIYHNLNPRWEESFDITTQGPIWLTATLWDWDTMGDHDCLGRTNIKLDPANFMDFLPKEMWLDLDTQGRLLLRVSMEGERDDIQFHFGKSFRTLKRTERDMTRQITDKLSAYIHNCLSRSTLKGLVSKGYNISAVTNLFGRTGFNSGRPQSVANVVTGADIAAAIAPLTDYFNENFAILNQALTKSALTLVMSKLWKEVLSTLESLLVPTLSDKPSQQRQLSEQETEIVFKWLQILFDFFHAVDPVSGEVGGVPLDVLKSPRYHDLQTVNFFYPEPTDNLIRESERMANQSAARQQAARQHALAASSASSNFLGVPGMGAKRSKSVINKRNLGTMRKVKAERWREAQAEPSDDIILRILRMRPEAAAYLKDRSRQKERLEAAAAAEAIVRQSMNQHQRVGSMGPRR